jgi:hypothetical protein
MLIHMTDKVMQALDEVSPLYYRLVLIVGLQGSGKTSALREVAERKGVPLINVNLEISRALLGLTHKQRPLQVSRLLDEIASSKGGEILLLDNIEVLFEPSLQIDPLRLLQGLSRNHVVLAAWSGALGHGRLVYAEPRHPEYRSYEAKDLILVTHESEEKL